MAALFFWYSLQSCQLVYNGCQPKNPISLLKSHKIANRFTGLQYFRIIFFSKHIFYNNKKLVNCKPEYPKTLSVYSNRIK
jgi:hypothetical protein